MLNNPNRETVEPIVVVLRIDARSIEVQVVPVRGRLERARPVVAVGATIVTRRSISVAGSRKEILKVSYHLLPREKES